VERMTQLILLLVLRKAVNHIPLSVSQQSDESAIHASRCETFSVTVACVVEVMCVMALSH
jgi:hypothetical protein